MRMLLALAVAVACVACRPADPPAVTVIPADVRGVDGGPALPIAAPAADPPRAIEHEGELPPGRDAIGHEAPGFSLDSPTKPGAKATLLAQKITVIHFWATWCTPCKMSFPALQRLEDKLRDRGVMVIAVSVDEDTSGIAAFARDTKVRFAIGFDQDHVVAKQYHPSVLPSTYVIDRSGIVAAVQLGYHPAGDAEIEELVRPLL